jgi:hypothetical protein
VHGNCHFNLRASATPQHKNPQPATSMTVPIAPHQTTASSSRAKFSNRFKPCCQPVKAMLPENWIGWKCQLLEMLTRLLQSYFHVFAGILGENMLQTFNWRDQCVKNQTR